MVVTEIKSMADVPTIAHARVVDVSCTPGDGVFTFKYTFEMRPVKPKYHCWMNARQRRNVRRQNRRQRP